jgi:alkylation response protein AidB-like acyl-CoA dehydrogenase
MAKGRDVTATADRTRTVDDVKRDVTAAIPLLRERAAEIDRLGMIPADVLQKLDDIGVFKIGVLPEFGGYAPVSQPDQLEILVELAKGNGSVAWSAWVSWGLPGLVKALGDQAVDDVFGTEHVGPLLAGSLFNPGHSWGRGRPVDGGYQVKGSWRFASNVRHCAWLLAGLDWIDHDGNEQRGFALLPSADLTIADDWHVEGMKGTSSNSAAIEDEVLVPEHRVIFLDTFFEGYQQVIAEVRADVFPTAIALGCAYGALDQFVESAKSRGAWGTESYAKLADVPSTQITAAKVRAEISLVEAALQRAADRAARVSAGEIELSPEEANLTWFEKVHGAHRLRAAAEELRLAVGSSTAADTDALGRYCRDIRVLSLHISLRHDWAAETFGKALLDVSPAPPFLLFLKP